MTSNSPMRILGPPAVLLAVVVGAVVVLFAPVWVAVAVGVLAGIMLILVVRRVSLGIALTELGAQPIVDGRRERIDNIVEGICLSGGFTPPRIQVVDVSAPDAAMVARSSDDADLVVTAGALDDLSRLELEALTARALCLLESGVESATILCAAGRLLGRGSLARHFVGRHLDSKAVVLADYAGVRITRYPPALASAMTRAQTGDGVTPGVTTDHLWLFGATSGGSARRPPLDQRIVTLQEL